jgi:uncharacterized protein (DUF2252 family)
MGTQEFKKWAAQKWKRRRASDSLPRRVHAVLRKLSKTERAQISRVFNAEEARAIVTGRHGRKDDSEVEVADAAYWVKGCSSLGRLRFAVLLRVGNNDYYRYERGGEGGSTSRPRRKNA